MLRLSQKGIAHLGLVILVILGIGIGLYLVQTRTNFLPKAQQEVNLTPQTAFHLLPAFNYYLHDERQESAEDYAPDANRTWFYPGEKIQVNLAVSSDIESANTFSAIINFPTDLLEVIGIQKERQETHILNSVVETGTTISPKSTSLVGDGCKVGGCSGQLCMNASDDGGITTCEWKDEYACYKNAKCEKQAGGQCGWTQTDDLLKCLASPKPSSCPYQGEATACTDQQVRCVKAPCLPQQVCKTFPTYCDIPSGWYLSEGHRCYETSQCQRGLTCDPICPPNPGGVNCLAEGSVCKKPSSNVTACTTDADCSNGLTCQQNHLGCNENTDDPNNICNIPMYCQPAPNPSCKPIPSCVYANPACDIHIDPNDPSWCHDRPSEVQDYFIKLWLPDTGFDNETGKIILSGGVTGAGLKTIPPTKPTMATITFRAKKAGEAGLQMTDDSLILRGSDSANILVNKNNLTLQIQDPNKPVLKGDLNGDGEVEYGDFSVLFSKWGSDNKKADLNGDGKVNIVDFSMLLKYWSAR